MSSLWNSLLAQADAEDRAALATALVAELRQQLDVPAAYVKETALLSPAEVAIRCGVHVETVRRAIRSGQLRAVKVGSRLRVDPDDLDTWGAASKAALPPKLTPARRQQRRRPAGVMAQAVSDLYPRQMKEAS